MSPPLFGSDDSLVNSSPRICQNSTGLKEFNYMGLSDCSSVGSSGISSFSEETKINLNLKATELRLGLPGSQSPERDLELCLLSSEKIDEKPLFSLLSSQKSMNNKRGFSVVMDGSTTTSLNLAVKPVSTNVHPGVELVMIQESVSSSKGLQRSSCGGSELNNNKTSLVTNSSKPPAAKAQVVGWPPVRSSFRKHALANTPKNNEEVDGKPGPGALFVKVSMDGAPYLRKVDLRTYSEYQELSSALGKMFSCFTLGQCGSHGAPGREMLSKSKLRDLVHGSEHVLTYEDKDDDWMLVGDVPWE
ncbi:hypothetical protein GIB67_010850 [Kingdonia uniflora]|uniref:Auxin-responsive protein n=1 Tax=Kingdonia uniflora TaxID=39325 RepID=A0A7J7PAV5_9MAGN|nr:hypothetical protein GIB67_010850 [Kingdonia uniflora]